MVCLLSFDSWGVGSMSMLEGSMSMLVGSMSMLVGSMSMLVGSMSMLAKLNYLFLNLVGLQLISFTEITSLESDSTSSAILLSN